MKAEHPIGIFDSGIGGLTVARALVDKLPHEAIIYFGDTAHLPYGSKSNQVIQSYAKRIVDFLLEHNTKLILIACHSASAAAYEMLQDYIGRQVTLVNVIDPVVKFLIKNYQGKKVGLIGTKLTVQSEIYRKKILVYGGQVDLRALATPLLVPIIEEGFFEHQLIDITLAEYLSNPILQEIDALILGCTHYPVIKSKIESFYRNKIEIIDPAKIVVDEVQSLLAAKKISSILPAIPPRHFYVSDLTSGFVKGTRLFFGEEVKVELLNIFSGE